MLVTAYMRRGRLFADLPNALGDPLVNREAPSNGSRGTITVLLESSIVSLTPMEEMARCAIRGSDALPRASTHPCRAQSPSGALSVALHHRE